MAKHYEVATLDAGNGRFKFELIESLEKKTNSNIRSFSSCSYQLQEWDEINGTDESPVIRFEDNTAHVLGAIAESRQGQYNYATTNKTDLTGLFLASIISDPGHVEIERLIVAVPDAGNKQRRDQLDKLVGKSQFIRNGIKQSVNVRSVVAIDETLGAYKKAIKEGLFMQPNENNVVITYGVGTSNFGTYDPAGNKIVKHSAVNDTLGLYDLAVAIAAAQRSLATIDPTTIMNALGKEKLITIDGDDFSGVFEQCHGQWLKRIRAQMKISLSGIRVSQYLFVGGPAPLLSGYVKSQNITYPNRFIIPDRPDIYAAEGMALC
jgi:hypothetical protein